MKYTVAIIAALPLPCAAVAQMPEPGAKAGDVYYVTRTVESAGKTNNGSSSSSTDRDTLSERVIAVRDDGLELEYDLPADASADDRTRNWQFPARIFKPRNGPSQLLNKPDLDVRLDRWLKAAKLPRTACGRWTFTWTAIRIECDPQSILPVIANFDLRPSGLSDGAPYRDDAARDAAPLRRSVGKDGSTYTVSLITDPDRVRRGRAETDVVTGEIMQKPVTLDAALRSRSEEQVRGTITITFDTDRSGSVQRRTKVTKVTIKRPDGVVEDDTTTETVARTPAAARAESDDNTI